MSDFAFNNYCIHCDKLCQTSSVYCSEECKLIELQQSLNSLNINSSNNNNDNIISLNIYNHHHKQPSTSSNTSTSNLLLSRSNEFTQLSELVSPLLTPALYHQLQLQQQLQLQIQQEHNNQALYPDHTTASPFMLNQEVEVETTDDYYDLNYFDLNYSVKSNINYTKETNSGSGNSNSNSNSSSNSLSSVSKSTSNDLLNSTSHNYRKWLTTAL
ncbi:predicted protein [Lodderomyces elongisporus NRRL YB-4239]|uniref:Uncharacterized protein n=1 Tax=Lodderomyces elongisporus (strain ATCC 11503 / CBS 2605 / JCM 1781 / NBRC 1676 / NRRL YB-4239) TaxID=379508 RepID=A5DU99_LODEL|nr:predicted protein [Lodderomyces elongisporus NRRL YB-4239]